MAKSEFELHQTGQYVSYIQSIYLSKSIFYAKKN